VTEDLQAYRRRAHAWLAANLPPRPAVPTAEPHREDGYTRDYMATQRQLQRMLYEAGYAGITWPARYGGQGLGDEFERAFREEAADYQTPDLGVNASTTYGVCGPTLLAHASEQFLAEHVPLMLSGRELWAQFFSEAAAGSDLAGVRTSARRGDDGSWVINGEKMWTSGGSHADYGLCLARTDPTVPKHRGLTWFAIPTAAPGVTVRPIRMVDGRQGFCQEFFDNVTIPDTNRIGDVNDGWTVTRTMLVFERDSGVHKKRVDLSPGPFAPGLVAAARQRGLTGDSRIRQAIAEAHTYEYVRRQIATHMDDILAGTQAAATGVAAYGKLAAGVYIPRGERLAMEIAGPLALTGQEDDTGMKIARGYLNGRIMAIAGGSNEMQRNGIGERVLGLPRERTVDPFAERQDKPRS
jgi:alkylation response protein AidB-like acyl-CoA dehydrogenase